MKVKDLMVGTPSSMQRSSEGISSRANFRGRSLGRLAWFCHFQEMHSTERRAGNQRGRVLLNKELDKA